MKKHDRSMGFDENPDTSREFSLDIDDDDDIIELEDIIEMPAGSIDEDEDLDLDVEILDAEPDLDFDIPGQPAPESLHQSSKESASFRAVSPEPRKEALEDPLADFLAEEDEDDLLKDLKSPADEDDLLTDLESEQGDEDIFERLIEQESEKKPEPPGDTSLGEDEDEFLQSLLAEAEAAKAGEGALRAQEPPVELRQRAEDALKIQDKLTGESDSAAPGQASPAEHSEPIAAPEPAASEPAQPSIAPAADAPRISTPPSGPPMPAFVTVPGDESVIPHMVEELVSRIEARLMESVRALVESRLPEVAREVIREEIQKIKKEIE